MFFKEYISSAKHASTQISTWKSPPNVPGHVTEEIPSKQYNSKLLLELCTLKTVLQNCSILLYPLPSAQELVTTACTIFQGLAVCYISQHSWNKCIRFSLRLNKPSGWNPATSVLVSRCQVQTICLDQSPGNEAGPLKVIHPALGQPLHLETKTKASIFKIGRFWVHGFSQYIQEDVKKSVMNCFSKLCMQDYKRRIKILQGNCHFTTKCSIITVTKREVIVSINKSLLFPAWQKRKRLSRASLVVHSWWDMTFWEWRSPSTLSANKCKRFCSAMRWQAPESPC